MLLDVCVLLVFQLTLSPAMLEIGKDQFLKQKQSPVSSNVGFITSLHKVD